MADMGGFQFTTPAELQAQAAARRQQVMVQGSVQNQRNQNQETALDTLFGNPQMKLAQKMQTAVQTAQQAIKPVAGESDLDREIRRLVVTRDAVSDISPDAAAQINSQLLKLAQVKMEQRKLTAETVHTENAETRDAEAAPWKLMSDQTSALKGANEGQNWWRKGRNGIERINTSVLDSLDIARLRKEGYVEGNGPPTEAEAGDALGLTKPATTDLQKSIIDIDNQLAGYQAVGQSYDPSFLTWGSQLMNAGRKGWEKLTGSLPADQAAALQKFSTFRANSMDSLNRVIHDLSGTATSKQEMDRMLKANPNAEEDSNSQFMAKLRGKVKDLIGVRKRADDALQHGLKVYGDQWDGIQIPPVSEGEVDSFLNKHFGVPLPGAAAAKPGASATSDAALIDRYKH